MTPPGGPIPGQPGTSPEGSGEDDENPNRALPIQEAENPQEKDPEEPVAPKEEPETPHEGTNISEELYNQAKEALAGAYTFHRGVNRKIKLEYIKNKFKLEDGGAEGLVSLLIKDGVLSSPDEHGNMTVTPPNGHENSKDPVRTKEREAALKDHFKRARKEILKRYTGSEKIGVEDIKSMLNTEDEVLARRVIHLLINSDAKLLSEPDENGMMKILKKTEEVSEEQVSEAETRKFPKVTLQEAMKAAEIREGGTLFVAGQQRKITAIREGFDDKPAVLIISPPIRKKMAP